MSAHFYSHLVSVESLIIELDSMELSDEERNHLAELVDSNLHQTVLDVILAELSEEDKRLFFAHLKARDNKKIWEILNTKVDGIETKIQKAAGDLTKELHQDLKEAKKIQN